MLRIFYGNRSFALLILPLLVVGYAALNFWKPYHLPDSVAHFGFWGNFLPQAHLVSQIVAPILILTGAIVLNSLFNRNDFMERNNFLTVLLYVTFMSAFHAFYFLDGFAIAQLFFIFALHQIFQLYQNEDGRRHVFNAAFLLGVACTFYPLMITVAVVVFWVIWVIRPFIMRESMLIVVGFLVPLMYAGMYSSYMGIKIKNAHISSAAAELKLEDVLIVGGLAFMMILLSVRRISLKVQQSSIRLKKHFRILLILINYTLLLTVLEYFIFHKKEALALVFVPLMFVLPFAFGYKKLKETPAIVYYLLFFFSVCKFLYPLVFLPTE